MRVAEVPPGSLCGSAVPTGRPMSTAETSELPAGLVDQVFGGAGLDAPLVDELANEGLEVGDRLARLARRVEVVALAILVGVDDGDSVVAAVDRVGLGGLGFLGSDDDGRAVLVGVGVVFEAREPSAQRDVDRVEVAAFELGLGDVVVPPLFVPLTMCRLYA